MPSPLLCPYEVNMEPNLQEMLNAIHAASNNQNTVAVDPAALHQDIRQLTDVVRLLANKVESFESKLSELFDGPEEIPSGSIVLGVPTRPMKFISILTLAHALQAHMRLIEEKTPEQFKDIYTCIMDIAQATEYRMQNIGKEVNLDANINQLNTLLQTTAINIRCYDGYIYSVSNIYQLKVRTLGRPDVYAVIEPTFLGEYEED